MNSICSLMQSIFAIYVMKHLSNSYTITSSNNSNFIKFIIILFKWFL